MKKAQFAAMAAIVAVYAAVACGQVCEPMIVHTGPILSGAAGPPVIAGDQLYFITYDDPPHRIYDRLYIYDISDRFQPRPQASLQIGGAREVAVVGDLAIVSGELDRDGGYLRTVAISGPGAPRLLGEVGLEGHVAGLTAAGTTAYATVSGTGLVIIDIAEPTSPTLLSTLATPGTAGGVAVEGSVAYLAAGDGGLRVIDVTDPAAPLEIASLTTGAEMYQLAVAHGLALIGADEAVLIIDVSDPAAPALLAALPQPSLSIADIGIDPPLLWFSTSAFRSASLVALDASDPTSPTVAGVLEIHTSVFRNPLFALDGPAAYIVDVEYVGFEGYIHRVRAVDIASCAVCPADCDASGSLDFFDFLCFQNLFGAGDPAADCDGSGGLDLLDFLCFQNQFAAGCP